MNDLHEPVQRPAAQRPTQQPVSAIIGVGQVAMADENLPAVDFNSPAIRQDTAAENFFEIGTEVKIVIPFDADDLRSLLTQASQRFEQRHVRGEDDMLVADPELEHVPQQIKGSSFSPKFVEEGQQPPIVFVGGIEQVRIGDEDVSHGRQLYDSPDVKVKDAAEVVDGVEKIQQRPVRKLEETMRALFSILSICLLAGCAFVKVNVTDEPGKLKEQVVAGKGQAKIAVVDISGVISLTPFGLDRFSKGPPLVPRFKEELERIIEDDKVVGVVVRIDSPGGSVTASDILYHELRQLREKKKIPIVACIMDKGFSGGYYAALAADEIMAHPTSVLGGVGVISFKFTVEELLDKWGIKISTVQSGPLKDFWSPLRQSRPEETAFMQAITDRLHERFLQLLTESRQLSPAAQQDVATGRIFAAEEALEIGLLDRIGYLDDAVARIRELAGVQNARVILYRREGVFAGNIYAAGSPLPVETVVLERGLAEMLSPAFRYQYMP